MDSRRAAWLQGKGPEYDRYMVANERDQAEIDAFNDAREAQRKARHEEALYADLSSMSRIIASAGEGPVPLEPLKQILRERVQAQQQHGTPYPGNESLEALQKLESGDPQQIGSVIADLQQAKVMGDRRLQDKIQSQRLHRMDTNKVLDVQYGAGSQRYKDQKGNLFVATTQRDKTTREFKAVLAPIGHNNEQSGDLTPVNDFGLTPEEMIKYKGDVKGTEQTRTDAAKESYALYKRIAPVKANVARLGQVARLVDEGVETGVIMKRLPSLTAQAKALDQLQNELGLDVIQNTTFGALSESEMTFALDTALPVGMEGPQLKQWALDKMNAQIKLVNYLEDAALFLSLGNTVADWIQQQRTTNGTYGAPLPPVNEKGWALVEDAQGNKAYMGPNGEYEEVGQ